jgi:hypothetical protein
MLIWLNILVKFAVLFVSRRAKVPSTSEVEGYFHGAMVVHRTPGLSGGNLR